MSDRDLERRLKKLTDRLSAGETEADRRCAEATAVFADLCRLYGLDPANAPRATDPAERRIWLYERIATGALVRGAWPADKDEDEDDAPARH